MSDYYRTISKDPMVAACDAAGHPTTMVWDCSPDNVLTRDGETSHACRHCSCGRSGIHVVDCRAGLGPEGACKECAQPPNRGHELWCKHGPKTMTMGELREMLTKAIELDEISETKRVGLLATREHHNDGGREQYLKPVMFVGVHFIRGEFVFALAENGSGG